MNDFDEIDMSICFDDKNIFFETLDEYYNLFDVTTIEDFSEAEIADVVELEQSQDLNSNEEEKSRSSTIFNEVDSLVTLKKRKLLAPVRKILDVDLRRKYLMMLTNTINSHDSNLIHSFFRMFCNKNTKMRRIYSPQTFFGKIFQSNILLYGVDGASLYWNALVQMMPDHVLSFSDVHIHTQSDTLGCIITAKYTGEATMIFEDVLPHKLIKSYLESYEDYMNSPTDLDNTREPLTKKVLKKRKNASIQNGCICPLNIFPVTEPLAAYISKMGALPRLKDQTLTGKMDGYLRMYLNAAKQIVGIDICS